MTDLYRPASEFLAMLSAGRVPLSANDNLVRLVELTRDEDDANRDWAVFLLSQSDIDTAEIRQALLTAIEDKIEVVRAEALLGLARRDRALALQFALKALSSDAVSMPVFEAVALIRHRSLADALGKWLAPCGDASLDQLVRDAFAACSDAAG